MKLVKEIGSWVGSIAIAFVLSLIVSIFIFQPSKVLGHSMEPTLSDTQRIYISKLSHTFSSLPDYGDIVIIDSRVDRERSFKDDIIESPIVSLITGYNNERIFYVKRVIGKPGDVLEFKHHKVYRNGEALDEPYLNETMLYATKEKRVVPEGHIFVMGDNRNHSTDSRDIGYIPLDHVIGKKIF